MVQTDCLQEQDGERQLARTKRELFRLYAERDRRSARDNFAHFCTAVLKDENNQPIKLAPIHRELIEHVSWCWSEGFHAGVLIPHGFGKSQLIAIGFPLFLVGQNQELRLLVLTNADDNSQKRVVNIGKYITEDSDYNRVFPAVKPAPPPGAWSAHRLDVVRKSKQNEGSIEGHGIDSSGTASRYDVAICDDVIDQKDAQSEAIREARKDKFKSVWLSRLANPVHSRLLYIATRWHKDDLTGELLTNERFRFLVRAVSEDFSCLHTPDNYKQFATIVRADTTVGLWEERWGAQSLKLKEDEIGKRTFARGWRQQPYSDDDLWFDRDAVDRSLNDKLAPGEGVDDHWVHVTGVDLAGESRPGTALVTVARSPKGVRYIRDVRRGNWGFTRATVDQIRAVQDMFNSRVVVENNAAQEAIINWAKADGGRDFPIKGHLTGRQKMGMDEGIPALNIRLQNDAYVIPTAHIKQHESSCQCAWCELIRELRSAPNCAVDDCAMALWICDVELSKRKQSRAFTPAKPRGLRVFQPHKFSIARPVMPSIPVW